jgi:hypothetical protein
MSSGGGGLLPGGDPPPRRGDNNRRRTLDDKRKGQVLIDSSYIRSTSGHMRGNPKCEVEKFERGTDMTIENWILQMETYFLTAQTPADRMVGAMLQKISPKYFDEVRPYILFEYQEFREKLFEIFGEPDTIHAKLQELARINQRRDETISEYMNRVRLLVIKAHRTLAHEERERILVANFIRGLADKKLAVYMATVNPSTSADAERIATAGEAMQSEQRARQKSGLYHYSAEAENTDTPTSSEDEKESEVAAVSADNIS